MVIKIEVTQEDIDNGQRGHPCRCALANAIERVFKKLVSVTDSCITVYKDIHYSDQDILCNINTPLPMMKFIYAYDKAREMSKPTIFDLELDDECTALLSLTV